MRCLLLAAAALAAAGTAVAQSAPDTTALPPQEIGTITPGQTRSGVLEIGDWTMVSDASWADVWYINATAGQRLVVELRSRRFDSYLQFLDPWGNKLADDDDSAGGSNARISFTVPAAGRYQIVVNSFGDVAGVGPYTLSVR